MITDTPIRLATVDDAAGIARMSRDLIEQGLGWKWTQARVLGALRDPETNVAVMRDSDGVLAFGIMSYRDDAAHLLLFAVRATHRRRGVGSLLLRWLEDVARTACIERIHVECRRTNVAARNFYGEHGYHEFVISKGYYGGVEDAIRFEKLLNNEN